MVSLLPRVAVVVPVYGNQESLSELYERIVLASEKAGIDLTLQFVNDRSPDGSQAVLERLAEKDPRVRVILLSRNHGSFVAIAAGLAQVADHEAAIILSADLQDPPEMIVDMVSQWKTGKKVVLCTRATRDDPLVSRLFAGCFNWIFRKIAIKDMPPGGFDFCLVDRQVIKVILESSEKKTSLMGLVLWAGFDRGILEYHRAPRKYGRSMWTFWRKLSYAVHSIVAFSSFPIKFIGIAGVLLVAISVLWILFIVVATRSGWITTPPGWSSLMVLQIFTMATTFIGFGIIGGYLWITLEQARKRPLFIVDKRSSGSHPSPGDDEGVPFFDLRALTAPLRPELKAVAGRALSSKVIILGNHVERFEREAAAYLGVEHVVGVANGTDALTLALWGADLGSGEKVAVPALTAVPTAVAVLRAGCIPVFVDVDPQTLLLSLAALDSVGAEIKAVVPVHLYGNPCDMRAIASLGEKHGFAIIEDCAQSFGSTIEGAHCGSFGMASGFSFYPTKNLGAYGDAGAVATNDPDLGARLRRMRFYGQDSSGLCVMRGMNSRLDEMQAALLTVRMSVLEEHNEVRRRLAEYYDKHLASLDPVPRGAGAVPHLYVVRPHSRQSFRKFLESRGIGTGVHYAQSLHLHPYLSANSAGGVCPDAAAQAARVVSLPCHPGMSMADAQRVVSVCLDWMREQQASS